MPHPSRKFGPLDTLSSGGGGLGAHGLDVRFEPDKCSQGLFKRAGKRVSVESACDTKLGTSAGEHLREFLGSAGRAGRGQLRKEGCDRACQHHGFTG